MITRLIPGSEKGHRATFVSSLRDSVIFAPPTPDRRPALKYVAPSGLGLAEIEVDIFPSCSALGVGTMMPDNVVTTLLLMLSIAAPVGAQSEPIRLHPKPG